MDTINLISSKRRLRTKRSWYVIALYSLFGIYASYFLFNSASLIYKTLRTNSELKLVTTESKSLSQNILSQSETVQRYVTTKMILGKILDVNGSKFPYKKYLDEIIKILPPGNLIKNVDFSVKEQISVTLESSSDRDFVTLENQFRNMDLTEYDFSKITVESLNRDASGLYRINLLFEFKNNGRK